MPRAQATSKKPVTSKSPASKTLPTTAEAALERLTELKTELAAANSKLEAIDGARRAVQKALDAAKAADNFKLAQAHLDKRNQLEADKAHLPAQIKELRSNVSEMHAHASKLYFAAHSPEERVTVSRVTVVNPETQNEASASYTDPSETIQLSVDGLYFESEAYHASSWAEEKGLFYNHASQELTV